MRSLMVLNFTTPTLREIDVKSKSPKHQLANDWELFHSRFMIWSHTGILGMWCYAMTSILILGTR